MRIKNIHIRNLRTIKDSIVELDSYNCFVGANGAGKSTVLYALNVFFRETSGNSTDVSALSAEDFHNKDTREPIEITLTFIELNEEAQRDFRDYFRHGQLVVSAKAEFNASTGRAEVKQFGQRLAMTEFKMFFERQGDKAPSEELKKIYSDLQLQYPDLPKATSGTAMSDALKTFEGTRPELSILIPSADQFYGVSKGSNRLEKHIQWVYIPAVKDAASEQNEGKTTALGKLLSRTVRSKVDFTEQVETLIKNTRAEYQSLLDKSQDQLDGISKSLEKRLLQWAHPDASLKVTWQQDSSKSVKVEEPFAKIIAGEGEFQGDISRFGHGFQRSFLLSILQELATVEDGSGPTLVLGCEEPELYQHPPQARHLANVLIDLSKAGSQILATSHSPLFVAGESFQNVRLVRKDTVTKASKISVPSVTEIARIFAEATGELAVVQSANLAKIGQIFQPTLSEMFFTERLVLVEGLEDIAYIHAWLVLQDKISAFRKSGCHLVPADGKSYLIRPAIIAMHMDIPLHVIFDADGDRKEIPREAPLHEKDNKALLKILGGDPADFFPENIVWGENFTMWQTNLGATVEQDLLDSLGVDGFNAVRDAAHARYGNAGGLKKNSMFIAAKLALALDAGGKSPNLEKLCDKLLGFGEGKSQLPSTT